MSTATTVMSTQEIANRLVELCQKGDFEGAHRELYAEDCVSIEPYATPDFQQEVHGLEAIREKGEKWASMVEENHALKVGEPVVGTNSFAVTMFMDVTMKGKGRMAMTELCVYQTKDGKIVAEQFFM